MDTITVHHEQRAGSEYSRLLAAFIQGAEESAQEFGRSLQPHDYTRLVEEFPQVYVEILHPAEPVGVSS